MIKVSHHLSLLREEYNKLQAKHAEVLRQLSSAPGRGGPTNGTFLHRILKFVGSLHLSEHLRYELFQNPNVSREDL